MENVELENMIDKADLSKVLDDLEQICFAKEDHLQSNWQDEAAAKLWHKCGKMIQSLNAKLPQYPGIS